jgi:hypothetical protein
LSADIKTKKKLKVRGDRGVECVAKHCGQEEYQKQAEKINEMELISHK